ncbi:MAG: hypothetical protein IJP38_00930, partial [Oscillospiraceae bacterium]|nr:hypothetical protein [Oscillospiraceae bacterium]
DAWGFVNIGGGSEYDPEVDHILYEYNLPEIKSIPEPDSSYAIALELDPDTSGTFNPTITVITETTAPIYEVYLMEKPANSSISVDEGSVIGSKSGFPSFARTLNKSKRLGLIDAYGTGALKTVSFPSVTVDAGTNYWLILSPNGANENREGRKATSGGVAYYRATLKLVSFTLTNKATSNSAFFNYDITTNALSDTAISNYDTNGDGNLGAKELHNVSYVETKGSVDLTKSNGYTLLGRTAHAPSQMLYDHGFWQEAQVYASSTDYCASDSFAHRPYYVVEINVPCAGKYSLSVLNNVTQEIMTAKHNAFDGKGSVAKVHFAKKETSPSYNSNGYVIDPTIFDDAIKAETSITFDTYYNPNILATSDTSPAITELGEVNVEAGNYYIILDVDSTTYALNTDYYDRFGNGTDKRQYLALSGIKLTPVTESNIAEIQSSYDAIVNVDAGNGEDVATTIENAEVKAVAADISGKSIADSAIIPAAEVAVGSSYTAKALEITGYEFLYWAKDLGRNRRIVSHANDYTFKVTSGGTLLMAVYKKTDSDSNVAMFYNGNGQLLTTQTGTYTVPTLPSMAGYDTATHWALHGSDEKFAAGATGAVSGEMRFVAQYDNGLQNVTVTVVNGTGGGEVAYGSDVTVTASVRNGTNLFNYWINENGEILSFDKTYTFKALKASTITAVYKEYIPVGEAIRKIVMTKDNKNNIFAEFLGIDNVIERGILFGEDASLGNYTAKVTMNTDANHFTVNNDLENEPEAIGYAILANGNVIYSK